MKLILTCVFAIIFALCTQAQSQSKNIMDEEVPAHVRSEFYKSHPTAVEIGWKQLNSDFIVEYRKNTFTSFALYSKEGKLLETKDKITTFAMPSTAYNYITENYGSGASKEYFKSINASSGTITYSAKVKHQEIVFDKSGSYLKTIDSIL